MSSSTQQETVVSNSDDTLWGWIAGFITVAGGALLLTLPGGNWDAFLLSGWLHVLDHLLFASGTTLFGFTLFLGGRTCFDKWWAKALIFLSAAIMAAGCLVAFGTNVMHMFGHV